MFTKPNAQLWRLSTAGTAKSVYWRGRVDAGRTATDMGVSEGTAFLEWAASPEDDPTDPATWRAAMPAMGYSITEETVGKDLASMSLAQFKRSHLNLWPDESDEGWLVVGRMCGRRRGCEWAVRRNTPGDTAGRSAVCLWAAVRPVWPADAARSGAGFGPHRRPGRVSRICSPEMQSFGRWPVG